MAFNVPLKLPVNTRQVSSNMRGVPPSIVETVDASRLPANAKPVLREFDSGRPGSGGRFAESGEYQIEVKPSGGLDAYGFEIPPIVALYDAAGNFKEFSTEIASKSGNDGITVIGKPKPIYVGQDAYLPNPKIDASGNVLNANPDNVIQKDYSQGGFFNDVISLAKEYGPMLGLALGANLFGGVNLLGGGAAAGGAGAAGAAGAGVPGGLLGSTLPAGAGAGGFFAPGVTAGAATAGIPTLTGAPAGVTPNVAGGLPGQLPSIPTPSAVTTSLVAGAPAAAAPATGAAAPVTGAVAGTGVTAGTGAAAAAGGTSLISDALDFAKKNPALTGGAIGAITGAIDAANAPKEQTTTTSIDPDVKREYMANLERAKAAAAGLGVRQFAGFTDDYGLAEAQLKNLGLGGKGQQTTDEAARLAMIEAGFTPQQIAAANAGDASLVESQGYTPQQIAAAQAYRGAVQDVSGQLGSQFMGAYFNPYEEQVVQGTLGDIERSRQMQDVADRARAVQARAFGGSRQGVQSALTNEAALRQAGTTAAGLRQAGFLQAAQFGQSDAARQLQAQMANQGVSLTLEQANAQLRQQAALSNQGAFNQAAQFGSASANQAALANAAARNQMNQYNTSLRQQAALANQQAGISGAGLRQSAIGQLGQLGAQQQNLGLTGANAVMLAQLERQKLEQQKLDAQRNLELERLGITGGALGLQPANTGGTSSQPLYSSTLGSALSGGLIGSRIGSLIPGP